MSNETKKRGDRQTSDVPSSWIREVPISRLVHNTQILTLPISCGPFLAKQATPSSLMRVIPSSQVYLSSIGHLPQPPIPLLNGTVKMLDPASSIVTEPYKLVGSFEKEDGLIYFKQLFGQNSRGLVVFCNGQTGFDDPKTAYKRSSYLAKQLAHYGWVVACIRHWKAGADNSADDIIRHVAFLLSNADFDIRFKLKGKPLVLSGASEGATGSMVAAQRIRAEEIGSVVKSVEAIVALAPPGISAMANISKSMLVLQGTHDGDAPMGAGSIRAYERMTGIESKHFIWIWGADHSKFLDASVPDTTIFPLDESKRITKATQHLVTQNYVAAFLLWVVGGIQTYRPLFIGDALFDFSSPLQDVQQDILSKRLRCFPRYDSKSAALIPAVLPGTATFIDMFHSNHENGPEIAISDSNPAKFSLLGNLSPYTSPAETQGLVVRWNRVLKPNPSVFIALFPPIMKLSPQFLEFQAVIAGTIVPPDGVMVPVQLRLTINNFSTFSQPLNIVVPCPLKMDSTNLGINWTKSVLATMRIALAPWIGANQIPNITGIRLNLNKSSVPLGEIAFADFRAKYI